MDYFFNKIKSAKIYGILFGTDYEKFRKAIETLNLHNKVEITDICFDEAFDHTSVSLLN